MYSTQAIRIGPNGNLKRMIEFEKFNNGLKFKYETGTTLTIEKINNEIIFDIKDSNKHICKPISKQCIDHIKPIKFANESVEYDTMIDFIKSTK